MLIDFDCEITNILGKNRRILEICNLIDIISKTDSPVLVQGESGTGKELVANAIHAHSLRCSSAFVKVDCAAMSENLIECELFGRKKGAFPGVSGALKGVFELADKGTILLDEVENISLNGQARLLDVMRKGKILSVENLAPVKVDTRIITTTNIILKKAVYQKAFLEELFDRLNVINIFLPPLRERKEDIPILVKRFIMFDNFETKKQIKDISPEAMDILMGYGWPGNVRELKKTIEHAVIVEHTDTIQLKSLPPYIFKDAWGRFVRDSEDYNLKKRLHTYERQLILRALNKTGWVKYRAAKLLGIDKRNLCYFIRKHQITGPEEKIQFRGIG